MAQFVRSDAPHEAGDRTVAEERGKKGAPELCGPEVKDQRGCEAEERQMAAGLQPGLAVAAAREFA